MLKNIFKSNTSKKEPKPKEQDLASDKLAEIVAKTTSLQGNDFSYSILLSPHQTEKASFLSAERQYVFKVAPLANKIEIKKAVERLYGVQVERVGILKVPSKTRRLGRFEGEKAGFKKAIVKLREGEKIES